MLGSSCDTSHGLPLLEFKHSFTTVAQGWTIEHSQCSDATTYLFFVNVVDVTHDDV